MKLALQKYRTTNWGEYNAALNARGSLLIWLNTTMNWHGRASGKCGSSPILRKANTRAREALDEALMQAIEHITQLDAKGWFRIGWNLLR
jgi:hypothetical protein